MKIPVIHSMNLVDRVFAHVSAHAPPRRFDATYLERSGFTGHNVMDGLHLLRFLDFVDASGAPTQRWSDYQQGAARTLNAAIRYAYRDLFNVWADAPEMPAELLAKWFAPPITSNAVSSRDRAIRTFRHLCDLAGMDTARNSLSNNPILKNPTLEPLPIVFGLPAAATFDDYEAIFRAAKAVFTDSVTERNEQSGGNTRRSA